MNKQTTGKARVRRDVRARARRLGARAWPLWSAIAAAAALTSACGGDDDDDDAARQAALVAQGKEIFRFDTFGDEAQVDRHAAHARGDRSAVDPTTALSVGLKVDAEALPAAVVAGHPERQHRPHEPGHHRGAAQAQRRGRPQGHGRNGQRRRTR